jgi:hypothetical protein
LDRQRGALLFGKLQRKEGGVQVEKATELSGAYKEGEKL